MSATAVSADRNTEGPVGRWELYKGWFLGLIVIVIVLAVGAGFWLHYHP